MQKFKGSKIRFMQILIDNGIDMAVAHQLTAVFNFKSNTDIEWLLKQVTEAFEACDALGLQRVYTLEAKYTNYFRDINIYGDFNVLSAYSLIIAFNKCNKNPLRFKGF